MKYNDEAIKLLMTIDQNKNFIVRCKLFVQFGMLMLKLNEEMFEYQNKQKYAYYMHQQFRYMKLLMYKINREKRINIVPPS